MTSYRRINSRTLNRDIQQQDNMVVFMKPISQAIYPKYFSVPDASNNHLLVSTGSEYSATAAPQLTFNGTTLDVSANFQVDGNTHVHALDVSGNITDSGNLTVYGSSHVHALDVSGNLYVQNNILSYGTIQAQQFLAGQLINVSMYDYSQLTIVSSTITDIGILFTRTYTPKYATSYLICEYQTVYTVNGNGQDFAEAFLYVDISNNVISQTYQQWTSDTVTGTGTRSGTILPIVGRYTNTDTTTKTIGVKINTQTDSIDFNADNSTWLKITEIGR